MMSMNTYPYLLNGQWQESSSQETIELVSPYKDEVVGRVQAMSRDEVDAAIHGAKRAQQEWAALPVNKRAELLYAWAEKLEERVDEIGQIIMQEVGKNLNDAKKEVVRTAEIIRYTAEEGIRFNGGFMQGDSFPGGSKNKMAIIKKEALGVVLAISPFNYPVNLAAAKIAPALVTGNAVVFKPATQGAISGIKMVEALHDAGLPKGLLNLVTGRGSVIGDYLTSHPGIDMITFTGGTGTGQHLSQQASMVPVVLELGGKDPALVLEDADLTLAADQIVSGAFSYSGQRCTAIKRVFVLEDQADELVGMLKERVAKLSVGSPEENSFIVPLVDAKTTDYVQGLIDDAVNKKATVVHGNEREGNLIYPTLLDHVTTDMRVAWEEPFGPVLPVIRVKSLDEMIELTNESEFGLQASVFTQNVNSAFTVADKLEVGTVQVNGRTERGPDHFPFIGVKQSGLGVQGIGRSLETMTRDKVTVINL
ncbi:NADP-dependent glyceraldehyde-3-phosphate dehydrogenase [Exiguobacterium sp. MMG028]|uniref:NADP-dependent glyceraldehyde-3-phosphate dehydrogenase n=1 Tax=Exiguobacterium sp. MMG028 TaxID=3021979 RepID=UPI0022FEBED3|nr:NADP-dependent glyceraldehyde-3-phosphate dehydrogenase [Exiguobacterium sp. MMG028]MDA5559544.1 NADP-dependent glyceraldehyde-3-phosphate dehydrogenase [Exiguobacterium sp. MMG028]